MLEKPVLVDVGWVKVHLSDGQVDMDPALTLFQKPYTSRVKGHLIINIIKALSLGLAI